MSSQRQCAHGLGLGGPIDTQPIYATWLLVLLPLNSGCAHSSCTAISSNTTTTRCHGITAIAHSASQWDPTTLHIAQQHTQTPCPSPPPPPPGFTSCVLAAPKLHALALLRRVLPLLAPSAPFVVFSPWQQPLAEAMAALTGGGDAVMLQLSESWTRQYQVCVCAFAGVCPCVCVRAGVRVCVLHAHSRLCACMCGM